MPNETENKSIALTETDQLTIINDQYIDGNAYIDEDDSYFSFI